MDTEKLFSKIWQISEKLRGQIDSWDFRITMLSCLFTQYQAMKRKIESTLDFYFEQTKEFFPTQTMENEKIEMILQELSNLEITIENIDVLGHAYEYLINMTSMRAGKSGGEFYTPPEVSELLSKLCISNKKEVDSIYDFACGSGSLLLSATNFVKVKKVYGQDINANTLKLAKMNMIMRGQEFFDLQLGNTLLDPKHLNEKFEIILGNPPYSVKWTDKITDNIQQDIRFKQLPPPKTKGDLGFVLHGLHHLQDEGIMGAVMFPGVLYRGNQEQKIREYLINNRYVECIINLPPNLFHSTSISTVIMILTKKQNDKVLFIDASEEFIKGKNKNTLIIDKILDTYCKREVVEGFSNFATVEEIRKQDYNLSVNTYVEQKDTRQVEDINKINADLKTILRTSNLQTAEWQSEICKLIDEDDIFSFTRKTILLNSLCGLFYEKSVKEIFVTYVYNDTNFKFTSLNNDLKKLKRFIKNIQENYDEDLCYVKNNKKLQIQNFVVKLKGE